MSQRSRRSFVQISAAAAGALTCLLACGGGGSSSTEGTLLLPTTAQVNGMTYRLNNATFQVEGPEPVTLSTADLSSTNLLQSELEPGPYTVRLAEGWVMEQQMGTTFAALSGATLTSMNPVSVAVVRGQVESVGFAFSAGDVTVDFAQAAAGGDDDYSD
jgi:hypothetical protein